MLKTFEKSQKTFTFRDGQAVLLKEPTLLQLKSARAKNDEVEQAKALLIDMSEGELTSEFLDSLPLGEWVRLSNEVSAFMGIDVKN
ncbi:phage tail assembly protein [Helicobacter jaachi]|uniref:Phage tail assembly protein n=1 Tax=Helicobacter jaachi TaxID=1677920 RepID=A0A4U8TCH9_9HELI|nr:phage tail assembly protein [Helicobacter jaachi]TLD97680.1 phage tail assembly protein [Helicobacter jaachi]